MRLLDWALSQYDGILQRSYLEGEDGQQDSRRKAWHRPALGRAKPVDTAASGVAPGTVSPSSRENPVRSRHGLSGSPGALYPRTTV